MRYIGLSAFPHQLAMVVSHHPSEYRLTASFRPSVDHAERSRERAFSMKFKNIENIFTHGTRIIGTKWVSVRSNDHM